MSRIASTFAQLKNNGQKALIAFITAGDPDLKTTEKLIVALEQSGADCIELGVPFSDPAADGPVIQRASERALKNKVNLPQVLALVGRVRKKVKTPIILMGYYNPILSYGVDSFCRDAGQKGVDGLIVVDLPAEEASELDPQAKKAGVDLIYLLTPTADEKRIQKIGEMARGFMYYVSMTGITGSKVNHIETIQKHLKKIKKTIDLPICIGFGIQTPDDAKRIAPLAEGVVVGSAIVKLIEESPTDPLPAVQGLVHRLKQAVS